MKESKKAKVKRQKGKAKVKTFNFLFVLLTFSFLLLSYHVCSAEDIKESNVAGQFYPADKEALAGEVDCLLKQADPEEFNGEIFALISPHAAYKFSGRVAAFGYKLIKNRQYKTVVILAPSHHYAFYGVSIYPLGSFRTPLGDVKIDSDFCRKIMDEKLNISFVREAFREEHSLEVQLPFLQRSLGNFKIVPVVIGDSSLETLQDFSGKLASAIGQRKDVLLIASTDLCHSYDYNETAFADKTTLAYLEKASAVDLYESLKAGTAQMCGGLPVISAMLTAEILGHNKIKILKYTNSAEITGKKIKGMWTVGYASAVIDKEGPSPQDEIADGSGQILSQKYSTGKFESEDYMLNINQKKRLLEIARKTIEEYVTNGKQLEFTEDDPKLKEVCGAFVTLHKHGELRGCIGSIIGQKPLHQTVRDMAIESATQDSRFMPVRENELKDIEIEISVLSPLKKITDINEFKLGVHGVLIRRGWNSGVFLPQVATETGWSKEEFFNNLCSHKAGLPANAWKDGSAEIFIFSALVFSEKEVK